ncbi:SDR family oxidoreductase [Clostridium folliculivorans]|uniref:NmrA family transcriptional regulator n=1 Tax=Clostridium folliculivorans TaxID=2886038 RepID=A0A9W6D9S6_9CLOT|nr:SDR family oxidoreductase [Clostridium folliculivorans]GKU24660.1 NmrA family transcriptional regulator [Clostridium folliculivorans]GKU30758.1 NmrA family transcriptional regulator [Clostridium folliculivorans]
MKILVTGASGNVGNYVVNELLKMGEKVVAAGTNIGRLKNMFNERVEVLRFDFTDESTFKTALEGVDRVFLMRPPHLGKPEDLFPFIDEMKANNIKLVCFLSLMGVENNTIPPHHKIEKYIETLEIPFTHIRPGFFMENISGIHSVEIREQDEVFIPAGRSRTSFIAAEDIGLSIAVVLHNPELYKNTAHTITGGEALDYYQVAEIISKVTGRKITYKKPGFLKYRRYYIKNRGLDKSYVNVTVALYFMTRIGTAKKVTDEFCELTGKRPKSFEEFVKENVVNFCSKL